MPLSFLDRAGYWQPRRVRSISAVNRLAAGPGEAERGAGFEKLLHLGRREMFGMLHGNRHSPAVCPVPPSSP